MEQVVAVVRGKRRRHSKEFKTRVLAQCKLPGVSVSAIALANGLNANLVRQWLRKFGVKPCSSRAVVASATGAKGIESARPGVGDLSSQFIPLAMQTSVTESIHVEVVRGNSRVCIDWPVSAAEGAAVWLRDVVR